MAETTKNRITRMLLSKNRNAQYAKLFIVMAACVVVAVAVALHQTGVAMTHKEQVLTCPVDGVVAHTHDESCYDKDGNLVCTLPERELHMHTDDCYTETRELTCGLEESKEHKHTDECYTVTRELTCGQEEVTEEHVHGPGCFTTIEVADEPEMPAQNFAGELKDQDNNVVLQVEVEAPEGAFPANTTMEIKALNADDVKDAVDKAVAQKTEGAVTDIQAIDIAFHNEDGKEIEPAKEISVRFISDFIAQNENPYVVHVNDKGKGDVVDSLTEEQLAERDQKAADNELYVDTKEFSPYAIAIVSLKKTLTATDGNTYTVTVDCPAEAGVPQNAELEVMEIGEGNQYDGYLAQVSNSVEDDVTYARFFDINILVNGVVFQPKTAVNVTVELNTTVDEMGEEVKAVRLAKDQTDLIDPSVDGNAVSFDARDFPVYGVVGTQTLTGHVITATGESYTIDVTYGPEAEIPTGAELQATEILEGSDEYKDYLRKSKKALATGNATVSTEDTESAIVESEENKKESLAEDVAEENEITSARFFDVSIVKDGKRIEPKAPVAISIHYDDAIDLKDNEELKAIHFASGGTEVIDVDNVEESEEGVTDVKYTQDSFSVTGTVVQYLSTGWPAAGDNYIIIVKPYSTNNYYAVKNDGSITKVKYESSTGKVTFTDLLNTSYLTNYKWTVTDRTYDNYKYVTSGSKYLDPNNATAITSSRDSVNRNKNGLIFNYTGTGYLASDYNYLLVNESGLKIEGKGSSTASNRAVVMLAKNFTVDETPEPSEDPSIEDLGAPSVNKRLTSNKNEDGTEDGTYQLALSVTGKSRAYQEHSTADVIIIFDRSGSMQYQGTTNTKMSQYAAGRRDYDAIQATKALVSKLLENNTSQYPNTVQISIVQFNNAASTVRSNSKNKNQLLTDVDGLRAENNTGTNWEAAFKEASKISLRSDAEKYVIFVSDGNPTFYTTNGNHNDHYDTQNGYTIYGSGKESSDTNVTRSYNSARDDAYSLVKDKGYNFYTLAAYDPVDRMNKVTAYAYSKNDSGSYPPGHYQSATDPTTLTKAFDKIISDIQKNFSYTNVEIDDGITALTATALVAGQVNNYTYNVSYVDPTDGKVKTVTTTKNSDGTVTIPRTTYKYKKADGTIDNATTTAVTLKGASYKNGAVKWELDKSNGSSYKLENGWTYEVSFTVWPTQKAYDLVADLANGVKTYNQLGETEKASIDPSTLSLMTNTVAQVKYQQISTINGTDTVSAEKTVNIENPPGLPLVGSDLKIVKRWNDDLDKTQLLDLLTSHLNSSKTDVDYSVRLDVVQDKGMGEGVEKQIATADYPDGFLFKPSVTIEDSEVTAATWPEIEIAVSPGVMLSYDNAHKLGLDTAKNADGSAKYSTIEYDGVKYYILEAGHRYKITEDSIDYHFELLTDIDHLMIVDGVLKNVILNSDGTAIESISTNSSNLTELGATNNLKGGINLSKVVTDSDGTEITPKNDVFTVKCTILDKKGRPYTRKDETVGDNDNDGIIYRVYAPDDELATVYKGKVDTGKNRTEKIGVKNSSEFSVKLKAGWMIRFINVPSGTTYTFEETPIPSGYELDTTHTKGTTGTVTANNASECKITNKMGDYEVGIEKVRMGTTEPISEVQFMMKNEEGQYLNNSNDSIAWGNKNDATSFTTDDDGKVTIGKLPAGTYYLEETVVKPGYVKPTSDVKVVVGVDGVSYQVYEMAQPTNAEKSGGVYYVVVPNSTGEKLPATGGTGTTAIYAMGIALVGIAAYGLVSKKMRNNL